MPRDGRNRPYDPQAGFRLPSNPHAGRLGARAAMSPRLLVAVIHACSPFGAGSLRADNPAIYDPVVMAHARALLPRWSQWREDHQDLVSCVVRSEPELAGPAARHPPAEPRVEVFESHSPAGRQVELFQAHLVAGDFPEPVHQGRSDAPVTVRKLGLQVVDCPPVGDEGAGVAAECHPSREGTADAGEHYPASLRVEAASKSIDCRGDVTGVDRWKRESRGPAGVRDRDPACDQFLPDRRIGFSWVRELDDVEVVPGRHGPTVSRRGVIPGTLRRLMQDKRSSSRGRGAERRRDAGPARAGRRVIPPKRQPVTRSRPVRQA